MGAARFITWPSAADDDEQAEMVKTLTDRHGRHTTEQKDRNYFGSVYFRKAGGILFEIATDDPGVAAEEAEDRLGRDLKFLARQDSGERPAALLPPSGGRGVRRGGRALSRPRACGLRR